MKKIEFEKWCSDYRAALVEEYEDLKAEAIEDDKEIEHDNKIGTIMTVTGTLLATIGLVLMIAESMIVTWISAIGLLSLFGGLTLTGFGGSRMWSWNNTWRWVQLAYWKIEDFDDWYEENKDSYEEFELSA